MSTQVRFGFLRVPRRLFVSTLALASLGLSACVHVRPYQRERLAHPTMTDGDLAGPGEAHARSVHEGATGGRTAGEAGCGCN
jgi:hypothetical protein